MNRSKIQRPAHGAIFYFDIECLGADGFRASCHAPANDGDDSLEEKPQIEMFKTRGDAQRWIAQVGTRRGFLKFRRRVRAP